MCSFQNHIFTPISSIFCDEILTLKALMKSVLGIKTEIYSIFHQANRSSSIVRKAYSVLGSPTDSSKTLSMQTASYLKDLFDLSGKTAVIIGGTGELCGTMAVGLAARVRKSSSADGFRRKRNNASLKSNLTAGRAILSQSMSHRAIPYIIC